MSESPINSPDRHYQGDAGRAYREGKRGIPPAALPRGARLRS